MLEKAITITLKRLTAGKIRFVAPADKNPKIKRTPTNTPTPLHCHKFMEIVLPLAGKVELHLISEHLTLSNNKLYVILPDTVHCERYRKKSISYAVLWIVISPNGVNFFVHQYSPEKGYYTSQRITTYPLDMKKLWQSSRAQDLSENLLVRATFISKLTDACIDALNDMDKSTGQSEDYYTNLVRQVQSYIDIHFAEPIQLTELSQLVRRSPNYLNAIFKRHTGKSLKNYLILTRLEHSKKLLRTTDFQIKTIARMCGFDDPLYFSRLFTKYFDISPKYWRMNE